MHVRHSEETRLWHTHQRQQACASSQLASKAPEKETTTEPLALGLPSPSIHTHTHTAGGLGSETISVTGPKAALHLCLEKWKYLRQHNFKIPYSAQP